jgi:hypothetical protein
MKNVLEQATISMDVKAARVKVAEYVRAVRERHNAEDLAILRGYRALAKGHQVIDLPNVIRRGGVFEETGLPRLAVATSSHEFVHVTRDRAGGVTFQPEQWINARRRKNVFRCPDGTLPDAEYPRPSFGWGLWGGSQRAMVPHVPPALRPIHSLDGYATLFEVEEWAPDPTAPADPALLKHIGGDLYAVLAVWDLSELERSVLNGRTR